MSQSYGIIQDHKGEIYVKTSKPGKGTTIEIKLPLHDDIKQIRSNKMQEIFVDMCNILWVDDDKFIQRFAADLVSELNCNIDTAANGKDALSYLDEAVYDTVITDIGMPEINGWQLAEIIRQRGYNTEIIVLTGWDVDQKSEQAKKYQINYVLQKPIEIRTLKKVITEIIGSKSSR